MLNSISARSTRAYAVIACIMLVVALAPAFGQTTFNLTASTPNPFAVVPGGKSASNLSVTSTSTSVVDVALSCQVTPVQATATPTCDVSPSSVTTPASPSLTITTASATPAVLYTITITAVDQNAPSNTVMVPVNLSVLAVTGDYTITVTTPVTPSTVTAGSGATAGITVTSLNGYSGSVTLSCSAVTPAVEFGPTCSFPAPVSVTGNAAQVGTLTITTLGTTTTTTAAISHTLRAWYALWLPLPGMALVAFGCGRKKLLAVLAPCVLALGLLLLPACGNSSNHNSTATANGVTPKNTYTLTITGADANAIAPSNGTQSVTLTVN